MDVPQEDLTSVLKERPKELTWIINGYALLLIYKLYLIGMVFLTHGHYLKFSTNISLIFLTANFVINTLVYQGMRTRKSWAWGVFIFLALQSASDSIKEDIGIIGFIEILFCLIAVYYLFRPHIKEYFIPKKPQ